MPPTASPDPAAPRPWPHSFPPPLILPPEPEPPRFQLGTASVIVLILSALVHVGVGVSVWAARPGLAAQGVGIFMFGFLVAIALSWVAWRLDPRRRAGELVFCFLLTLFSIGRINEIAAALLPSSRNARQAQTQRAQPPSRARKESPAAPANAATDPTGPAASNSDHLRQTAARYDGDARRLLETEARVMDGFQIKQQAFQRALNDLKAAGIVSVQGLNGLDALARRRVLVKNFDTANNELTAACQTMEGTMRAAMLQAAPGPRGEQATGWFMEGFHLPVALRIRDCAHREAQAMDNILVIYTEEYPYWRLGGDNRVAFDRPGVAARHQFWMGQLTAAAREEDTLQKQLAAEQKAMAERHRATGREP